MTTLPSIWTTFDVHASPKIPSSRLWRQIRALGAKGSPRVAQREPKGAQGWPKGNQREPEGDPKGTKGSPRVTQREPKGAPGSSKGAKGKPRTPQRQQMGDKVRHRTPKYITNSRSTAPADVMLTITTIRQALAQGVSDPNLENVTVDRDRDGDREH